MKDKRQRAHHEGHEGCDGRGHHRRRIALHGQIEPLAALAGPALLLCRVLADPGLVRYVFQSPADGSRPLQFRLKLHSEHTLWHGGESHPYLDEVVIFREYVLDVPFCHDDHGHEVGKRNGRLILESLSQFLRRKESIRGHPLDLDMSECG